MKININSTLSAAFDFYKNNLKKLLTFSAISVLPLILVQFVLNLALRPGMSTGFVFLGVLFDFAVLVLIIKCYLATDIFINGRLNDEALSIGEAFKLTRGRFWRYVGNAFLLGLIIVVPSFVLVFLNVPYAFSIMMVGFVFVMALYYPLTPMAALELQYGNLLGRARQMVKGNYARVVALQLITTSELTILHNICDTVFAGKTAALLAVDIVYYCLWFLLVPFAAVVSVLVYRELRGNEETAERTGY
ncbi:MAG: hypothetical protein LBQ91_03065 [Oscillospiraceae bacterium]|jgi:hypothetical protein|nr:hypothetical protein [Oscillospiraceae bacterium]